MIAIDIDDTISEYVLECIRRFGPPTNWSGGLFNMFPGVDFKGTIWANDHDHAEFLLGMEQVPGASWYLIEMRKLGIPFMYLSAGKPGGLPAEARKTWMKRNQIPDAEMVLCGNFEAKGAYIRANKELTAVVDDHPDFLNVAAEEGLTCYVFDRPWNRDIEFGTRVMGWSHLLMMLKRDLLNG